MEESGFFPSVGSSLSSMMDLDESDGSPWAEEEFGAILAHQLAAPLEHDLRSVDPEVGERLRGLAAEGTAPLATFRDLLHHAQPPLQFLELTHKFAKRCHEGPERLLPSEVATILYLLSITVARTRCHARISRLDDQSLRVGLQWALAQSWPDEDTRRLLREGLAALGPVEQELS